MKLNYESPLFVNIGNRLRTFASTTVDIAMIVGIITLLYVILFAPNSAKAQPRELSCYAEGTGTANFSSVTVRDALAGTAKARPSGTAAGIGLGCDYHFASGFYTGALVRYTFDYNADAVGLKAAISRDGAFRGTGMLGYAFTDRASVYLLVGAALTKFDTFNVTNFSSTPIGIVGGIGADYAITPSIALRAEYAYTDYDSFSKFAGGTRTTVSPSDHALTLGVKFQLF